eukprot:736855-Rhodomonas_salina.1
MHVVVPAYCLCYRDKADLHGSKAADVSVTLGREAQLAISESQARRCRHHYNQGATSLLFTAAWLKAAPKLAKHCAKGCLFAALCAALCSRTMSGLRDWNIQRRSISEPWNPNAVRLYSRKTVDRFGLTSTILKPPLCSISSLTKLLASALRRLLLLSPCCCCALPAPPPLSLLLLLFPCSSSACCCLPGCCTASLSTRAPQQGRASERAREQSRQSSAELSAHCCCSPAACAAPPDLRGQPEGFAARPLAYACLR